MEIKLFIEKSISAICDDCGELGYFTQAWLEGSTGSETRSEFFCPACGNGIGEER